MCVDLLYFLLRLQRHPAENWKQIFPEMKLLGLVPNSLIHESVRDLYIPTISRLFGCSKMQYVDQS
jgi:hypothetical protein